MNQPESQLLYCAVVVAMSCARVASQAEEHREAEFDWPPHEVEPVFIRELCLWHAC